MPIDRKGYYNKKMKNLPKGSVALVTYQILGSPNMSGTAVKVQTSNFARGLKVRGRMDAKQKMQNWSKRVMA